MTKKQLSPAQVKKKSQKHNVQLDLFMDLLKLQKEDRKSFNEFVQKQNILNEQFSKFQPNPK